MIVLLDLLLFLFILFFIWGLFTEVLIPLWTRTPWFPHFRGRRRELEKGVERARERVVESDLREEIRKTGIPEKTGTKPEEAGKKPKR